MNTSAQRAKAGPSIILLQDSSLEVQVFQYKNISGSSTKRIADISKGSSHTIKIFSQEEEGGSRSLHARSCSIGSNSRKTELAKTQECKTYQLPTLSTTFVERHKAIAQLNEGFASKKNTTAYKVIRGAMSTGKTQLALQYAHAAAKGRHLPGKRWVYDHVLWFRADTSLDDQFVVLAALLTGSNLSPEDAVEEVYDVLEDERALIVFDDADPMAIQAYLPKDSDEEHLHILITSRRYGWSELPTLELGGFDIDEATRYVNSHLGIQPKEKVQAFVKLLNGMPLAICQAVAFIKAGHCTIDKFEDEFLSMQKSNLVNEALLEGSICFRTVGTTLAMILNEICRDNELPAIILNIAAYLYHDEVPISSLCEALEVGRQDILDEFQSLRRYSSSETCEISRTSILNGIRLLNKYSLVCYKEGEESFQINRSLQELLRQQHNDALESKPYWSMAVSTLAVVMAESFNISGTKGYSMLRARGILELSKDFYLDQETASLFSSLLELFGMHQYLLHGFEFAKTLQERCLEIREQYFDSNDWVNGVLQYQLSDTCRNLNQGERQKQLLKRAVKILESNESKEGRIHLIAALHRYGDVCSTANKTKKRMDVLKRAVNLGNTYFADNKLLETLSKFNLGSAYGEAGKPYKQIKFWKHCLDLCKADKFLFRYISYSLGECYISMGQDLKAEIQLENALNTLKSEQDLKFQKKILKMLIELRKRLYCSDHVKLGKSYIQLTTIHRNLNNPNKEKEALKLAVNRLSCLSDVSENEIKDLVVSLENTHGSLDRWIKSCNLESDDSDSDLDDGEAMDLARSYLNHAFVYRVQKNYQQERKAIKKALALMEDNEEADKHETKAVMTLLAENYAKLEMWEKYFETVLEVYEEGSRKVFEAHLRIAEGFRRKRNFEEERDILNEALDFLDEYKGFSKVDSINVLSQLAAVYRCLKNESKAKKMEERAAKLRGGV